ncbi:MAG TPA: ADP-ribosylglycohydrolase family protein [Thermoanaerobaculia bacterium]
MTLAEKLEGAIWGLLIGDALGVPYEFHHRNSIPSEEEIEFTPPAGFARSHVDAPPGTWSDDGAQALCLLASLLYRKELDVEDLMRRITNWYELGYMAADGLVFDIGVQTSIALMSFRAGTPAAACGPNGESDNGNGSLMRVLPLALWHTGPDADLIRDARRQSVITHGHVRSQLCCALYCLWARRMLEGHPEPWGSAVGALRATLPSGSGEERELESVIRPDERVEGRGTGYVVDSLWSVRNVLELGTYEAVVKAAIRLGNDTDTTAAIAGGLAGIREGIHGIPQRWRDGLRDRSLFSPLVAELVASRSARA